MHACEVHAHKVHACKVHTRRVYATEVHACKMYTYKVLLFDNSFTQSNCLAVLEFIFCSFSYGLLPPFHSVYTYQQRTKHQSVQYFDLHKRATQQVSTRQAQTTQPSVRSTGSLPEVETLSRIHQHSEGAACNTGTSTIRNGATNMNDFTPINAGIVHSCSEPNHMAHRSHLNLTTHCLSILPPGVCPRP
jgi:hypothetical protein